VVEKGNVNVESNVFAGAFTNYELIHYNHNINNEAGVDDDDTTFDAINHLYIHFQRLVPPLPIN